MRCARDPANVKFRLFFLPDGRDSGLIRLSTARPAFDRRSRRYLPEASRFKGIRPRCGRCRHGLGFPVFPDLRNVRLDSINGIADELPENPEHVHLFGRRGCGRICLGLIGCGDVSRFQILWFGLNKIGFGRICLSKMSRNHQQSHEEHHQ